MAVGFENASGIRVTVIQKSTGEMLAQIRAERATRAATCGGAAPATRMSRRPRKA